MRWANFDHEDELWCGLVEGETVLAAARGCLSQQLGDLPALEKAARAGKKLALADVKLRQPIIRPGKILAIGLNYAAHVAESVSFISNDKPEVQKWFNKQSTAANGPDAPIHVPKVSEQLDYEAELVLVIGKHGRHVPKEKAFDIIAGVTCGCDCSVRDWQKASPTMIMGKGFDTHAPFGPHLVTLDELGDLGPLAIRGYVNDELRQEAKLADMVHRIEEQIAHLTAAFTLEPGDVIFTGTPAGVGAGHTPPKWLKPGDKVRVEIEKVGTLENPVVAEPDTMRIG
ncbi:MAG TPA: fumarylacetoacetate hydrolase family protein [Henriciella marina]|uniref:fumarylacetoacetate hydrolase family protein n=1 Tax=Henriciella sp. TaxID=1968823 RepID=UPI001840034F|nr:fumarylacetoacetate hydrolase family protein [Henriciella sp.]HIG23578.1 fumarylacetoacetate hydrolase family protein [Henriciella sp.]HIK64663.1 fumarylacetoacetate hydrolase family protein [Henriciella marina]